MTDNLYRIALILKTYMNLTLFHGQRKEKEERKNINVAPLSLFPTLFDFNFFNLFPQKDLNHCHNKIICAPCLFNFLVLLCASSNEEVFRTLTL